ncbi:MAG: hypothetical protein IPL61_40150 [Myxococcales bacterium]|nr:hypothetical protein [Myxococcales bacterium]
MRRFAFVLGSLAVAVTASPAVAGPDSDVASAFDRDDGFDLHLTFDYQLDIHRAAIRREQAGRPGTPTTAPVPVVDDLVFASTRHTVVPKLELGLFHDVSLSAALPITLAYDRTLELDQRDTPCTYDIPGATCVSRTSSTTLTDGLLPMAGYDGQNAGAGFMGTDPTVFRGPTRKGVDQLHLGFTWAPMNQLRDDTKPTWKLGAEFRIAVGKVAAMNRLDPGASTGVGRGVHDLRLSTSIAKQLGWAEPFVDIWWQVPIGIKDGSPFESPGFGARSTEPSQRAGTRFGFEAYAVDQGDEGARLSIELSAHLESHFEGREQTEMWEVFALAGDASGAGPLRLDADPTQAGMQTIDHPGITTVENYLDLGARVAGRIAVGDRFRIAAHFEMLAQTEHVITFTDAGVDLPQCTGSLNPSCELDNNDLVTPNTNEVNPLHVPLIDLIGHRYHADDSLDYQVGVNVQLLF